MGDFFLILVCQVGVDCFNFGNMLLWFEVVVLDWVGIVVDFGLFVLMQIFVEVFVEFGVVIMLDEVCGFMGLGKWDYICMLCNDGVIVVCFLFVYGCMFIDDDVIVIYNCFMLLQIEKVGVYFVLILGVLDIIVVLCEVGLKIGMCLGYLCVVMDCVVDLVVSVGYMFDCVVVCDEVFCVWLWFVQVLCCVVDFVIGDVVVCVKVDDIVFGIEEGCWVGMWIVVLLMLGNVFGLLYEQYVVLFVDECVCYWVVILVGFFVCCLYYEIDMIVDLFEVVVDINCCFVCGDCLQCI